MKKKLLFIGIFGLIIAVGGGISTFIHYQKTYNNPRLILDESHQLAKTNDLKTLKVTVYGDNILDIMPSEDESFHIYSDAVATTPDPKTEWAIKENGSTTQLDITHKQGKPSNKLNIGINFGDEFAPQTNLKIPSFYEELEVVIDGSSYYLTLDALSISNVTVKNMLGDTFVYNLIGKNLDIQNKTGAISIVDTHLDNEITLSNNLGDINLNGSNATSLDVKNNSGNVYLENSAMDATIESQLGDLYSLDFNGKMTASTQSGEIKFEINKLKQFSNDISLTTQLGDIDLELSDNVSAFNIEAQSTLGDIDLFDKNRESFSKGKGGSTIKLKTKTGSISANSFEEYND